MKHQSISMTIIATLLVVTSGMASAQGHHDHGAPIQPAQQASAQQTHTVTGQGVIKSINIQKMRITIAHEPIKALNWPEMTMPFSVSDASVLEGLKADDKITFELKDGQEIISIKKI